MSAQPERKTFAEGDVRLWGEQDSSIHLKAVTSHGDPVELTSTEAQNIANALHEAACKLEAL